MHEGPEKDSSLKLANSFDLQKATYKAVSVLQKFSPA